MGTDRHQLANMAGRARDEMAVETLEVVADRGYYDGEEIRACEEADITVTLPKPMTSGAKAAGRFGKQDFVYIAAADVYRCPLVLVPLAIAGVFFPHFLLAFAVLDPTLGIGAWLLLSRSDRA